MHGATDTEFCARCFREPGTRASGGPPLCEGCRPTVEAEQARLAEAAERRTRRTQLGNPSRPYCGLTRSQVEQMHAEQDGRCAICLRPTDPFRGATGAHVDHCRRSGVIRGLLCGRCNGWLARIDDDVEFLERMAAYLRRGHELAKDPSAPRGKIRRSMSTRKPR